MAEAAADEVLLVGRYLSPFVRRVAVTLRHFGVPYRCHVLSTLTDMDEIARYSPIGRVPVMVLPTGETRSTAPPCSIISTRAPGPNER